MKRLLICKDIEQKTVLEVRELNETENIVFEIVDNPPEPEHKDGFNYIYALNEKGELELQYKEIPKSELEELKEQVSKLTDIITELLKNNK